MSSLLTSFSVELRLRIGQYLTAQELQVASSSCKLFYQFFANQDIWENAYTSLLNGYPINNFSVTHLVRFIKRLDFVTFDKSLVPQWLDDWSTSWKQKTIFILHILKVQGEIVSVVRQKTDIFESPKDTPLYDANFITALESHLGAVLPIDFVVFLQNFAHRITFDTGKEEWDIKAVLASGTTFEDRWNWQNAIDKAYFPEYDEFDELNRDARDRLLTTSSRAYLSDMTIACFSLLQSIDDGKGKDYAGLILDANQSWEDQIPKKIEDELLQVDFQSMKNGVGKVVYNAFFEGISYQLKAIAESFTDYLVQWASVVIVNGHIPSMEREGYADLTNQLPRHSNSLLSVLLPQYKDWDVGNYAPIYFSMDGTLESSTSIPSLATYGSSDMPASWDSRWPDPPDSMMHGCCKRYWKPYYLTRALHSPMLGNLQELQRDRIPGYGSKRLIYPINIELYNFQQKMIDEWASLTPYRREDPESEMPDVEIIKQHTSHIKHLFDKLKSRLPVALYYEYPAQGHRLLYYYKCFLEHLQALELDAYRYNLEELIIFESQVRKNLRYLRRLAINDHPRTVGSCVDLDAIAELAIDWSVV